MKTKIQFGEQSPITIQKNKKAARAKGSRSDVKEDGIEGNTYTKYAQNVKFENIKAKVNVCRVKIDDTHSVGIAKGAILAGVPITVPTNDDAATAQAMKKRCDFKPAMETVEHFKVGHGLLMSKFAEMPTIQVDNDLVDRYLDRCGGAKAQRLMDALSGHEWSYSGETKHVFAKQEALLKEHQSQPRVVYQGTDMYNAITGPVVMELHERMKKIFSKENPLNTGKVIYACGVSGEKLGDIMEQAEGIPIESDMKNNDGSQSAEFRKYEAMFYHKLGAPVWFVREFAKNTKVRVWTRYGISAIVEGERWSGETTTTTGNSYVSMALVQASLLEAKVQESTNIHGGDDYLGYVVGDATQVESGIEKVVSASGMKAEVVPQTSRHHATFYRKRYINSPIGCRPIPQFGRVVAKLNLRANRNLEINDRDYMAGKYLSAAYEHRHVPIIRELLVNTADTLSSTPHFDVRASKMSEMGGVQNIKNVVSQADVHPLLDMSDALHEVYGIGFDDLLDVYERVSQSCIDYCDGWTYVDQKGKTKNVKNSVRYDPPKIGGEIVDALLRLDVS